jgi:thiol-disulfide isomerase/thioredoxin
MSFMKSQKMNGDFNIRKGTRLSDWTAIKCGLCSAPLGAAFLIGMIVTLCATARAATDLTLSPNLSFTDDSSPHFPIEASNIGDASIARGRPTVIFFGTSNCWNTAREAERLVQLYPEYRDQVHFVVVDLRHASPAQQRLAHLYYSGYIPTLAIFDKSARLVYDRAGETAVKRADTGHLRQLIESALR